MEKRSGHSELSVISWVSTVEGCPLSGVPLHSIQKVLGSNLSWILERFFSVDYIVIQETNYNINFMIVSHVAIGLITSLI